MLKRIQIILIIACFCTNISVVFAYDAETTHVSLAEKTVQFYNLDQDIILSESQKQNIIQGSIDEDDNTRALNHFYDPTTGIGLKGTRSALDWVTQDLVTNEYGWQAGVKYFAEGNEDLAYLTLGHILHLIEDMTVPDHTRDDGHAGNLGMGRSSLEDYARRSEVVAILDKKDSFNIANSFSENINEIFNKIASYSNSNFFSDDTIISNKYNKPLVVSFDKKYAYSFDTIYNKTEKLANVKLSGSKYVYVPFSDTDDYSVLSSYLSRLSEQAILAGIQTIKAFIKEGEKARVEYLTKQAEEARISAEKQAKALEDYNNRSYLGRLALNWWQEFTQPFALIGDGFLVATNLVGDLTVSGTRTGLESSQLYGNLAYGYSGEALTTGGRLIASAVEAIGNNIIATYSNFFNKNPTNNTASSAGLLATGQITENKNQNNQASEIAPVGISKKIDLEVNNNPADIAKKVSVVETKILASSPIKDTLPPVENNSSPVIIIVSSQTAWGGEGNTGSYISNPPPPTVITEEEPEMKVVSPVTITDSVCDQSFGLNDCVVATTTVTLGWQSPDTDIAFYQINQNGDFGTTTATSTQIQLENNSSVVLEIRAVNVLGRASATTTKKISATTNPIIFNEIAWGGTVANSGQQWLELYNRSPFDINLDNFNIQAERGITMNLTGEALSHKYFLITRQEPEFNSTVFSNLAPDLSLSFGNDLDAEGEYLSLNYEPANLVIDVADFSAHGYGSCGRGCTSEYFNGDWLNHNSDYGMNGLDADGNAIFGTPGKRNTASYRILNDGEDIVESLNILAEEENTPVIVPNTIYVNQGATLYLTENTTLRFMPGTNLYIDGQLIAEGSLEKPINFQTISDSNRDKFGGLTFSDASSTSLLKNVVIENSANGIVISYGGSLVADNLTLKNFDQGFQIYQDSELLAEGLDFVNSKGDNFTVFLNSTSTISDLSIDRIKGKVASVYLDSSFRLSSSTIENASTTVFEVFLDSKLDLSEVEIENVEAREVIAVYANSSLAMSSSSISNITGDGLEVFNGGKVIVENSEISNVGGNGLDVFSNGKVEITESEIRNVAGSGLEVFAGGEVKIENSKLENNTIGALVYGEAQVEISSSSITGNTEYGISNLTPDESNTIVLAENNWWGSADGPTTTEALLLSSTTDGLIPDRVSVGVDFSPWLATTSELVLE